jgi:hypothetical protein
METYLTFNSATKKITAIDKTFTGNIIIPRTCSDVDILIIGHNACESGQITGLDLSSTIITTIETYAFCYCYSLSSLSLPNTLTTLTDNCFALCSFSSFHLPESIITFNGYVLNQCPNLDILTVDPNNPNFITIKNFIFSKDLRKLIRTPIHYDYENIPNFWSIETIGYTFCSGSSSITKFISTPNIRFFESRAFLALGNLKYIDIRLSCCETLLTQTFWDCSNLEIFFFTKFIKNYAKSMFQSIK